MLSKRQRPKIDEYAASYLFAVLHFPVYDKAVQRLNAAELDVFIGQDYLVTLPNVELLPVTRLFAPLRGGRGAARAALLEGLRATCSTTCSTTSSTTASRSSTRSATSSTRSRTTMFEGRAEDVVRDISNVKQEIISYRKIIKPERSTLRLLERRVERFLPEELELYFDDIVDARRADLGPARQLQGGRRGARADQRVGDLAPPERHPADPHGLLGRPAAADAAHRDLRHERPVPRLRDRGRRSG